MRPGDIVEGENGLRFQVGKLVTIQGKADCTNPECSHRYDENGRMVPGCMSYHCAYCGASTAMTGHDCPASRAPQA